MCITFEMHNTFWVIYIVIVWFVVYLFWRTKIYGVSTWTLMSGSAFYLP